MWWQALQTELRAAKGPCRTVISPPADFMQKYRNFRGMWKLGDKPMAPDRLGGVLSTAPRHLFPSEKNNLFGFSEQDPGFWQENARLEKLLWIPPGVSPQEVGDGADWECPAFIPSPPPDDPAPLWTWPLPPLSQLESEISNEGISRGCFRREGEKEMPPQSSLTHLLLPGFCALYKIRATRWNSKWKLGTALSGPSNLPPTRGSTSRDTGRWDVHSSHQASSASGGDPPRL